VFRLSNNAESLHAALALAHAFIGDVLAPAATIFSFLLPVPPGFKAWAVRCSIPSAPKGESCGLMLIAA
jgi:hypothetical protein